MSSPSQTAFRRVLIPLDLSAISVAALPFAIEIARCYGATLVAMHAIPEGNRESTVTQAREAALDRITQMLNQAGGPASEVLVEHGDIIDRLAHIIEASATDLLVIGASGSHGLKRLLRGSGSQEIMCSSQVPVLAVGTHVTRPPGFQNILYATDFSPASEAAFVHAVSIAEHFRSVLSFLHVNDWNSQEPPIQAQAKTLDFFSQHIGKAGIHVSDLHPDVLVKFGARADQILEVATGRASDLIVMGVHCKHGLMARVSGHLPGPVSYEVMTQAPCAVLAVPSESHLRHA
jgi:nucleotide-binding universal stress UspA family protein